jgi:signal transduction histidine kinase
LEKQQPAVALRGILRLQESIGSFQRMLQDLLLANRLIDSCQVLEITSWESSFFRQWTSQVLRSFSEADQGRVKLAVNGAAASMTDAAVIEPLLFHLLSNALKFSDPGAEVELLFDSTSHGLAITVTDSGIGIPPAERARVGEPFFRASNVGGRGGLGLGAYIVRALVNLHGGCVSWEPCAKNGTQVHLFLAPPEALDGRTPLS